MASGFKENTGLHTIINILIGLVVGVAVMWFLIMPAVNSSRQRDTNEQTAQFSDQVATQEAQISALQKELEEYRSTSEASRMPRQPLSPRKRAMRRLSMFISILTPMI